VSKEDIVITKKSAVANETVMPSGEIPVSAETAKSMTAERM
jgi:hypothetical protein